MQVFKVFSCNIVNFLVSFVMFFLLVSESFNLGPLCSFFWWVCQLSILFIFSKNQLLDLSILCSVSISLIFALIFVIFCWWLVGWLFLVVNLTVSGVNYNPEMEHTPVRDFPWFEAGEFNSLVWIKRYTFDSELGVRRHILLMIWSWGKKTPL